MFESHCLFANFFKCVFGSAFHLWRWLVCKIGGFACYYLCKCLHNKLPPLLQTKDEFDKQKRGSKNKKLKTVSLMLSVPLHQLLQREVIKCRKQIGCELCVINPVNRLSVPHTLFVNFKVCPKISTEELCLWRAVSF